MRKILNRVTVSGADDQTSIQDMEALSKEFPFVEWGILLSGTRTGPRYPSLEWLKSLRNLNIQLAGHICGQWAIDVYYGDWRPVQERLGEVFDVFGRVQVNFASYAEQMSPVGQEDIRNFVCGLPQGKRQFIFQLRDNTHTFIDWCKGFDVVPFLDCSGGTGVSPGKWKEAKHPYTGYAGGLSPDNLTANLVEIEGVCGAGPIWIDVESRVRNEKDQLDLGLVRKFLETAKPWII